MKPLARPAAEGVAHPLVVPRAALAPDPHQPRQSGIGQGLDQLVESIRTHGIIQPILVRPHPDPAARARTPYMIVVGERRWTAAGRAGRDEVPVFLLDQPLSPARLLMLQIEENEGDNRQDLPLHDLVAAVARAFQQEGLSQAEFARRHGKSTAWVSYRIALHRAGGAVAEALREGRLRGILVARTFQRLTPAQQQELLARARKDGSAISLVATEKLAGRAERRPRGVSRVDRDAAGTAPPATLATAGIGAGSPAAATITSLDPTGPDAPAPATAVAPLAPTTVVPAAATAPHSPIIVAPASVAPGPVAPRPGDPAPSSDSVLPAPAGAVAATGRVVPGYSTPHAPTGTPIAVPGASLTAPGTRITASGTTVPPMPTPAAPAASDLRGGPPPGSPPTSILPYRGGATPARLPAPLSATPAAAATPAREPALLSGASAGAAIAGRSLPAEAAPASPSPAAALPAAARHPAAAVPPVVPRAAAAGLLAAGGPMTATAGPLDPNHPTAAATPSAARFTVELSLAQLQKLVGLLGLAPAATPQALVHQLMTSL